MYKKIVIATTSARTYAQAAVASGYEVVTFDAFADTDLKNIASEVFQVKMPNWKLDVNDFKRKFKKINLTGIDGFCYGSIFDAEPTLLDWVARQLPIIGNKVEVLKRAKAFNFFDLLKHLNIQYPRVSLDLPKVPDNWLSKKTGGTGGVHVRPAQDYAFGDYFQQKVMGEPVSMLFLANGKEIQKIGFNRQLIAPTRALPYRYAGAVGNLKLQDSIEDAFCNAAKLLTNELGLLGINSLDGVLHNDALSILELNPRLSASFELYPNLWDAHVKSCEGVLISLPKFKASKGKMTIFADADIEIMGDFNWPIWVSDVPDVELFSNKILIKNGAPICTVLAEEETAELAYMKLLNRSKELREIIK